jgi:hypothetical protein
VSKGEGAEKRRTPRVQPYVVPCRLELPNGRVLAGYVTDISPRGTQVSCQGPPPAAGIQVTLELRLRRAQAWPRLQAEVKWTRPPAAPEGMPTCGLTFLDLQAPERELLEDAISDFVRRAAQLDRR